MFPVLMMVLLCFTSYSLSEKYDKLEVDLMLLLTITQFKMVCDSVLSLVRNFGDLDIKPAMRAGTQAVLTCRCCSLCRTRRLHKQKSLFLLS